MIAVHITHESTEKMGGIGAVIEGLTTTANYHRTFSKTIIIGPLLQTAGRADKRLGSDGKVLYSSLDGIDSNSLWKIFKPIEQTYQVGVVYGKRRIHRQGNQSAEIEVILFDVFRYNHDRLNLFKRRLFEKFGIRSDRFEHIWEYEQYIRLAEPAYDVINTLICGNCPDEPVILFAHEYMGLPTALKAIMAEDSIKVSTAGCDIRTVFYAHEVAPIRRIVEDHPGHDVMFYNLLNKLEEAGKTLGEVFPEIHNFFKYPLVKSASYCDAIFAVGDLIAREMKLLSKEYQNSLIEIVYNGLPNTTLNLAQRLEHRNRMKQYTKTLLGFEPDYIFTHVARPVLSKGIWRDFNVLHELDKPFSDCGKKGVYFLLGTLAGKRRNRDILHMEKAYGWPVNHRIGYPDLCNGEETIGIICEDFNRHHQSIRTVMVNQFGWERRRCGLAMNQEMSIADIRYGTDVEFGLSVYEPFGISQLEPLSAGAICVVSSICGCVGLIKRCCPNELAKNIIIADYVTAERRMKIEQILKIDKSERDAIEARQAKRIAKELLDKLPRNQADIESLLNSGSQIAQKITWQNILQDYFLPAIEKLIKTG